MKSCRTTRRRASLPRPPVGAALAWLALMPAGYGLGVALAGFIEMPREAAPPVGMRFVPARDRDATALRAEIAPGAGALCLVTMDYPHPDDGTPRAGQLAYDADGDFAPRLRREMGGYAGPALRQMARALRAAGNHRAAARAEAAIPYRLEPDVALALRAERRLTEVADRYHSATGSRLTITSGARSPEDQARAMRVKLELGDDVIGLYGGGRNVREIEAAYREAIGRGLSTRAAQDAMEAVIRGQMEQGRFISNHLLDGAVDIRSRDMDPAHKRALEDAARASPHVRLFEEKTPPHFHMNVTGPDG